MASYLLFFRNTQSNQVIKQMQAFGLEDLGVDKLSTGHVAQGPDGQAGAIAGWLRGDKNDPNMTLDTSQQWIALPANGAREDGDVWIGITPSKPLTPNDVAREHLCPGNLVTLRDGNQWLIPAAQDLPHKLKAGPDNTVEREVEDRFAEYYKSAFNAMQSVFAPFGMWNAEQGLSADVDPSDQIETITIADGVWLATKGLNINYRINQDIALALGLLDEHCMTGIIACTFDMPAIAQTEAEKKNGEARVSIPATSLT